MEKIEEKNDGKNCRKKTINLEKKSKNEDKKKCGKRQK